MKVNKILPESHLILMDARSSANNSSKLVQRIRNHYNSQLVISPIRVCSFVVGNRCAVVRKNCSDLTTAAARPKLAELLRNCHDKYDEVYLLVEKDQPKTNAKLWQKKQSGSNPNFQFTIQMICHSKTLVLYSENQVSFI